MLLAQVAEQAAVPTLKVPVDLLWQLVMGVGGLLLTAWGGSKVPWKATIASILKKVLPVSVQASIADHVAGPTNIAPLPPSREEQLRNLHDAFWLLRTTAPTLDLLDRAGSLQTDFWLAMGKSEGLNWENDAAVVKVIPPTPPAGEGGAP